MERDLFYILQDIKEKRNECNSDLFIKKISDLYEEFDLEERNFKYLSRKQVLYNIRYIIFSFATFGIYSHFAKDKFYKDNEKLDELMDEIEKKYYALRDKLEKMCRSTTDYSKKSLNKNYDQIENFLLLMKSASSEEKEKILNYKIGGNNE